MPGPRLRSRWLWLAAIAGAALLPRILLLFKFRSVLIESDEAVVGLMARRMLHGEIPLFYWGQSYMGTIEPMMTALLFFFLGPGPVVLKLGPLIFFGLFVWAHYYFAREIAGVETAVLATGLLAVSPAFLTIWSLKARGGYMALVALGTLALLLTGRMLRQGYRPSRFGLLGLVLGLAWWTHFLAIVYLVPILAILLLQDERRFLRAGTPLLAGGFLLGSLPFWIVTLRSSSVVLLPLGTQQTDFVSDASNFLRVGIPVLAGARRNWAKASYFSPADPLVVVFFLVALAILARRWFWKPPGLHQWEGQHLALMFALIFPVLFFASGLSWFVEEPRYLLPLYSVFYILLLSAIRGRRVRMAAFGLLLALNLSGSLRTQVEEFVGYTNVEPNGPLIDFLRSKDISRVYAPYWIAYRLTFETGEQIVATPPSGDVVRYPPYMRAVQESPRVAYVKLAAPRYSGLHAPLEPAAGLEKFSIGNYEVFLPY